MRAPEDRGKQPPAEERVGEEAGATAMKEWDQNALPGPRRGCLQRQGQGSAKQEQWRGGHRQKEMLGHMNGKHAVGVEADGREEGDSDDHQPRHETRCLPPQLQAGLAPDHPDHPRVREGGAEEPDGDDRLEMPRPKDGRRIHGNYRAGGCFTGDPISPPGVEVVALASGTVNQNELPTRSRLSTPTDPPCASAMALTMASPKPTPAALLVLLRSTLLNR